MMWWNSRVMPTDVATSTSRSIVDDSIAGFMLTNPSTLGLFETQLEEIAELIHSVDGLIYMDGANMNALLGIVQPGKIGFDIIHFNIHKTFPHRMVAVDPVAVLWEWWKSSSPICPCRS